MRVGTVAVSLVTAGLLLTGCAGNDAADETGTVGDVTSATSAAAARITSILAEPAPQDSAASSANPDSADPDSADPDSANPDSANSEPAQPSVNPEPAQPSVNPDAGDPAAAASVAPSMQTPSPIPTPAPSRIRLPDKDTRDALTVWLMPTIPDDIVDQVTKRFRQDFPKVDVTIVRQDWATVSEQLQQKLPVADLTPDVVEVSNAAAPTLSGEGLLTDLSSVRNQLRESEWTKGLTGATRVNGALTSVPVSGTGRVVAYDETAWKAAGVTEEPASLEQFGAALQKVQSAGVQPDYSAFWFPGRNWPAALPWMWSRDGVLAYEQDGAWVGAVDSSEVQAGLLDLQDLVKRFSKAPADADATTASQVKAYDEGRASAALMAPWEVNSLTKKAGIFALPGEQKGSVAPQLLEGTNLALSSTSIRQGLGAAWLKAFLDDNVQADLAKATNSIPALSSAVSAMGGSPLAQAQARLAQDGQFTPPSPRWATVTSEQVLADMLQTIVSPPPSSESASAETSDTPADPAPSASPTTTPDSAATSPPSTPAVPGGESSAAASVVPSEPIPAPDTPTEVP